MGKHSAERRSALPLVLATVAVLAIAVAAFVVVRVINGSSGSTGSSTAASPVVASTSSPAATSSAPATSTSSAATATGTPVAGTSAPTTSAADAAARAALKACVDHQAAAKAVVDAITTGATHWSDHVQGQTDLNTGARTLLQVKTDTWGPTRSAGPQDVATFQAAQAVLGGAPGCPTTAGSMPAPADVTPKLQACVTREAALDTVVATGTKVMADWQTHLSEMADHADGHIDSVQAQNNWIKRWSEAGTDLNPYQAAVAGLASAPACSV